MIGVVGHVRVSTLAADVQEVSMDLAAFRPAHLLEGLPESADAPIVGHDAFSFLMTQRGAKSVMTYRRRSFRAGAR